MATRRKKRKPTNPYEGDIFADPGALVAEQQAKEIEDLRQALERHNSHSSGAIQEIHHYTTLLNDAIRRAWGSHPCAISIMSVPEHVENKEARPPRVEVSVRTPGL